MLTGGAFCLWLAGSTLLGALDLRTAWNLRLFLNNIWTLVALSLLVQLDISAWTERNWGRDAILGGLMIGGALLVGITCVYIPQWWDRFWGKPAVLLAMGLWGLCITLTALNVNVWWLTFIVYLLATSVVAARIAASKSFPATTRQWFVKWRGAFLVAAFPTTTCLLPLVPGFNKLFGGVADYAPVGAMVFGIAITFWTLHERKGALGLGAFATTLAVLVGFIAPLPAKRLSEMNAPGLASTSQAIQARWSIGRGGNFGRGATRWIGSGNSSFSNHSTENKGTASKNKIIRRSPVPLATTDAIWALIAEIWLFWLSGSSDTLWCSVNLAMVCCCSND